MATTLLTAFEAAALLGVERRTAQRRAAVAFAAGDEGVYRVGRSWAAAEDWWRAAFASPPARGRPRVPKEKNIVETP